MKFPLVFVLFMILIDSITMDCTERTIHILLTPKSVNGIEYEVKLHL